MKRLWIILMLSILCHVSSAQGWSITLEWKDVAGASKYHVQVARNSTFSQLTVSDTVPGVTHTVPVAFATKYWWRVRSGNQNGFSAWSSVWTFTTLDSFQTVVLTRLDRIKALLVTGTRRIEQTDSAFWTFHEETLAMLRALTGNAMPLQPHTMLRKAPTGR